MASYARAAFDYGVATAASMLNSYFYVLGAIAGMLEGCLTQYLYLFPGGQWVVKKLGIGYTTKPSPVPAAPASDAGDWYSESSMGAGVLRAPREGAATPNFDVLSFPIDPPDSDNSPNEHAATLVGHEALIVPAVDNGSLAVPDASSGMEHGDQADVWSGTDADEGTSSAPASVASNDTAMDDGRHKERRGARLRHLFRRREKNEA